MYRPSKTGSRVGEPRAGEFTNTGITTSHQLLTSSWTADVERVERAISRSAADRPLAANCQVSLFEIAGDSQLHVNVVHHHPTVAVQGWAGPGRLAGTFIHNRRFGDTPPSRMIRQIREMVFAARA
jgi:hypothetical protein